MGDVMELSALLILNVKTWNVDLENVQRVAAQPWPRVLETDVMECSAVTIRNASQGIASTGIAHIIKIVIQILLKGIVVMGQHANWMQTASLDIAFTEYAVKEVTAQVRPRDQEISVKGSSASLIKNA